MNDQEKQQLKEARQGFIGKLKYDFKEKKQGYPFHTQISNRNISAGGTFEMTMVGTNLPEVGNVIVYEDIISKVIKVKSHRKAKGVHEVDNVMASDLELECIYNNRHPYVIDALEKFVKSQ